MKANASDVLQQTYFFFEAWCIIQESHQFADVLLVVEGNQYALRGNQSIPAEKQYYLGQLKWKKAERANPEHINIWAYRRFENICLELAFLMLLNKRAHLENGSSSHEYISFSFSRLTVTLAVIIGSVLLK